MKSTLEKQNYKATAYCGILGVILFVISFIILGSLNSDFSFIGDFVSKLGARGEPNALLWNIIGFGMVGLLMIGFGLGYGVSINDKLAGILLALFGAGFMITSIPVDMLNSNNPYSKAHIVAICFALAFWLFGLARISYNPLLDKKVRVRANMTAVLIVASIIGFALDLWSEPLTHRLVFILVFGWTLISAIEVLKNNTE